MCSIAQTPFWNQSSLGKAEIQKGDFLMTPQPSDWCALAERASKETDPSKLLTIVEALNRVLEREQTCCHMSPKGSSA